MPFVGIGVGVGRQRFAQGGGFVGLLDEYSGAAAAYSLRQLSTTYTGDAIRVRRASDSTEQDIGFVGNELDTATLESFCSGTDGFVTTWYDQSGSGNNSTQTTAANQPKIVTSGSVLTYLSKPSLLFDGTNDTIQNTLPAFALAEQHYIVGQGFGVAPRGAQTIRGGSFWRDSATRFRIINGGSQYYTTAAEANNLLVFQLNLSDNDLFLNNIASTKSGTITPVNNSTLIIGGAPAVGTYHNSYISEYVVFSNVVDRGGKQTNINDYYGIY